MKMTMTIKLINLTGAVSLLLLPVFAGASIKQVSISSPANGYLQRQSEQVISISGTIQKRLWENQILKQGGTVTIYASAADRQLSYPLTEVTPLVNLRGRITGYDYNKLVNVEGLRGEVDLSMRLWIEAKDSNGSIVASDEVWGTIQQAYRPTLSVTLSQNTPSSSMLSQGAINANFVSLAFTAGAQENVMINQITLTRSGGTDDDLLNIRVFDGATQVSNALARFVGDRAMLTGLTLVVLKDSTKTLVVKIDVDVAANTYSVAGGVSIGVANLSDIQAIGAESANAVNVVNFVPVFGNTMGISLTP